MKNFMLLSLIFAFGTSLSAQGIFEKVSEAEKKKQDRASVSSVYVEALGNAGSFSVNYDYIGKHNVGFRAGITPLFFMDTRESSLFPLTRESNWDNRNSQSFQILTMVSYYYGTGHHRLETGAGFLFASIDEKRGGKMPFANYPALTATLGYRFLPEDANRTFKLAFTPILHDGKISAGIGISLGIHFTRLKNTKDYDDPNPFR